MFPALFIALHLQETKTVDPYIASLKTKDTDFYSSIK
jgi:hypothetical protein